MGVIYDSYCRLVNNKSVRYDLLRPGMTLMGLAASEKELRDRVATFVKSELKRGKLTYADLAERLKEHGLPGETENGIKAKLARGTFAATFLVATLAALEMEGMRLEDL
jgi:hypothetical protein